MKRLTILAMGMACAVFAAAATTNRGSQAGSGPPRDPAWLVAFDAAWNAPRAEHSAMPRNMPRIRGW